MNRRAFITFVGGAAAWPVGVRAATGDAVVGFLSTRSPGESAGLVAAVRRGLGEVGFVEGRNVLIAFRWAEGHYDRLAALAADLVGLRVGALLAAGGAPSALAAKAATSTIPVVFTAVNDPIRLGLVASLNRPGGNVTGMSDLSSEIVAKSVQLLRELVPAASAIAYLVNPSNPSAEIYSKEAATAASTLGIELRVLGASTEQELDETFASLRNLGVGGLVVPGEPFFDSRRDRIGTLSARYEVAAIYPRREFVVAGGLMSYGPSLPDLYRWAGIYVGRVLKGERPNELPVMLPTKFELVLNLRTAKALGINVPDKLPALTDEVIE